MPVQLHVLEAAIDRRPLTPAELDGATGFPPEAIATPAAREALADDVAGSILRIRGGKPLWRQLYYEQLRDRIGDYLRPARWPIEGEPPVYLGGSETLEGLYRVGGECRHYLYRNGSSGTRRTAGDPQLVFAEPLFTQTGENVDYTLHAYRAGFVLPGQIEDAWAGTKAYLANQSTAYGDALGSWLAPNLSSPLMFEVTTPGTSGGSEPAWPLGLAPWSSLFSYTVLNWLQPPTSALLHECTIAGESGVSEPSWATVAGQTTSDGTATWTARAAMEVTDGTVVWTGRLAFQLPTEYRRGALLLARKIAKKDQDGKKCKSSRDEMLMIIHLLTGACF